MKHRTKKMIKYVLLGLILLILMLLVIFLAMKSMGKKAMLHGQNAQETISAPESDEIVLEDEGEVVIYRGEKYIYNKNITSILCMGIDKEDMQEGNGQIGDAGQADMLMLAILDMESGKINLWNISRDVMTDVDIYNVDGQYVETQKAQACLAFAYGDGGASSCENTIRSVSRLLYGMPIQSYAAIDMDAIAPLNDAVGGVEVTIYQEDTPVLPEHFKAGTTMLLLGEDVEWYVQSRRTPNEDEAIDSNNYRIARQKQYMMNFVQKALQKTKEDLSTPVNLFRIAMKDNHMITNLDISKITYLTTIFSKVNFTEENIKTIVGEVVEGEEYAEFYVNEEALYQMILDTFYIKED